MGIICSICAVCAHQPNSKRAAVNFPTTNKTAISLREHLFGLLITQAYLVDGVSLSLK
ncbi:unnamed protein product [Diplocarpon coronariae]